MKYVPTAMMIAKEVSLSFFVIAARVRCLDHPENFSNTHLYLWKPLLYIIYIREIFLSSYFCIVILNEFITCFAIDFQDEETNLKIIS